MDVVKQWREQVVDGLLLTFCITTAVGFPFIWAQLGVLFSLPAIITLGMWIGQLTTLILRRRLPLAVRSGVLLAELYCALVLGIVMVGPVFGPALCGALFVVLAGLIHGRRPGFAALGIATVSVVVAGGMIVAGWLPPPPANGLDMTVFGSWAREAAAFAMFTSMLAVATAFIVRRVEGSLQATSHALARVEAAQVARELTQAQLVEAERQVAELQRVEALGRLAGGVAHDFNNALLVLLGGIELMRAEARSTDTHRLLDDMQNAADGAAQLTAQLLAYGRRDVPEARPIAPADVLQSTVRSLRRVLPDDVAVEVQVDDPPTITADPRQLEQVLLNLAINARDAMPGGGTLTLSARGLSIGGAPHLRISVQDTGTGIDPAVRGRIFEPFFTTKELGEGTGLGLSMVFGVVTQLGGRIDVDSELDVGTTFHLDIPASEGAVATAEPDAEPEEPNEPSPAASASAIVLVAEDEPLVRKAMVDSLERAGFDIIETGSVPEALKVLEGAVGSIDVLCTDGVMVGGNCKPLIDAFRRRFPSSGVLVCSGHLREDLVRRDIATGAVEFLQKPFRGSELVRRVNEILDR